MKRIVLATMLATFCTIPLFAQFVDIPDNAFLKALIDEGVDTNNDGLISETEAQAVHQLEIANKGIKDLSGIASFTYLETLFCEKNALSQLDLSNNPKLKTISCYQNLITNIDVSQNHALSYLNCHDNLLEHLDIRHNLKLTVLNCSHNHLSALNLTHNAALISLDCSNNQFSVLRFTNNANLQQLNCSNNNLERLDLSNNSSLTGLIISGMPSLDEVNVWTLPFPPVNVEIDASNSPYVDFNMDNYGESHLVISDNAFLLALLENGVDENGDQLITHLEAERTISLDLRSKGISSIEGIDAFINLDTLRCDSNHITELNLLNNVALRYVSCENNLVDELVVPNNTMINYLSFSKNNMTYFNAIFLRDMETLLCADNVLNNLYVSNCNKLKKLDCSGNNLTELNVSNAIRLEELNFSHNNLETIDLNNNADLLVLNCSANQLNYLEIAENQNLHLLNIANNQLCDIELSNNFELESLIADQNNFYTLRLNDNLLLKEIKLRQMPSLHEICIAELFTIDKKEIDTTGSDSAYFTNTCDYINNFYIPDQCFLQALIKDGVDSNHDGLISYSEASTVVSLDISNNNIRSLCGIEYFTNLDSLNCNLNQITQLDLSDNTGLTWLRCDYNRITSLDFSSNPELTWLNCDYNNLTSLSVQNNAVLEVLFCGYNELTSLVVLHNPLLKHLGCSHNKLTDLQPQNNTYLETLKCNNNFLRRLDISNNTMLEKLDISNMYYLKDIEVWTMPFPPNGLWVNSENSPNIFYVHPESNTKEYAVDGIKVYPNPVNDYMTIETESAELKTVEIFSMNGQVVFSEDKNEQIIDLDLSCFSEGIYCLVIQTGSKKTMKKIMKL
jgi:Leucine-rich repeat (LRR) protein